MGSLGFTGKPCAVRFCFFNLNSYFMLSVSWVTFLWFCVHSLGVVRNLVSFFQLRCCGLFKPVIIDWTQQFQPGHQHVFGHTDMVWPPPRSGSRVRLWTKSTDIYLLFFNVVAPCGKRLQYSELGKRKETCRYLIQLLFVQTAAAALYLTSVSKGKITEPLEAYLWWRFCPVFMNTLKLFLLSVQKRRIRLCMCGKIGFMTFVKIACI